MSTLLQLPDTPIPTWARVLPTGGEGGVRAFQIDGSGLETRNRMMYRKTLPMGTAPGLRAAMRYKSSLVATNPTSEGFAVRFRGFNDAGAQVWDSQPETLGSSAWKITTTDAWTDAVFIADVPTDQGIVTVTFEIVVRASSGLLTICKPECRYHYAYKIPLDLSGKSRWVGLENTYGQQIIESDLDTAAAGSSQILRWVRYARTASVDIPRGKYLTAFTRGAGYATAVEIRPINQFDVESRRLVGSTFGVMLKLRIKGTGQYKFITIASALCSEQTIGTNYAYLTNSVSRRAEFDHDQIEVQLFIEPTAIDTADGWSGPNNQGGAGFLFFKDLEVDLVVADYLEATQ